MRNEIPISDIICLHLDLPHKIQEGYLRFLCPHCNEFYTAINPKTNLARCFQYKYKFKPIDLVMTVKKYSFLQAVDCLEKLL